MKGEVIGSIPIVGSRIRYLKADVAPPDSPLAKPWRAGHPWWFLKAGVA